MTTATPPRPSRDASDTGALRIAAIDVGSNSIHMVIAQADADGGLTTLWRQKEMVGLGRMSFPSHKLSQLAMDRAVEALRRFQLEARRRNCEKILAVATSAVREAENGGDFIERARGELGLHVRVVSAKDEARLIYHGVRHAIDLKGGPHLLIDIGGGSVEFVVGDAERTLLLESRKMGAARMTARYVKSDPISPEDRRALLNYYDRELSPLVEVIRELRPVRVIGTSGTMENLCAMSGGLREGAGAHGPAGTIRREAFAELVERLLQLTSEQRGEIRGLDDQRKEQVIAGALLVRELFTRLDLKEITLCRSALREGMLVEYLSRHIPDLQIRREVPDPRRRSVLDLARRCDWKQQHAEQVARLCASLFDQLRPLHGLGREWRELIEYAAMLHDIGFHVGRDKHHLHSMYLILHGDLKDFTRDEVRIIANIARYHRKAFPSKEHAAYARLPKDARRVVKVGAALLRLADGLDRSNCAAVGGVRARVMRKGVRLKVEGRMDTELEIWSARSRSELFEKVFKTGIEIVSA